jgi:hypothetical protein
LAQNVQDVKNRIKILIASGINTERLMRRKSVDFAFKTRLIFLPLLNLSKIARRKRYRKANLNSNHPLRTRVKRKQGNTAVTALTSKCESNLSISFFFFFFFFFLILFRFDLRGVSERTRTINVDGYFVINVNGSKIRETEEFTFFKIVNNRLSFRNVFRLTVLNAIITFYRIRGINNAFFKRPNVPFIVRNRSHEIARILDNTRNYNDNA